MFVYNSLEIPVEKPWVLRILEEYRAFLISYHKEQKAVFHHLRNAANIFIAMEDISPKELTYDWLEHTFEYYGKAKAWRSLSGFMIGRKLIQAPSENGMYRKQCEKYIAKVPESFQKCLKWYVEDNLRCRSVKYPITQAIRSKVALLNRICVHCIEWFDGLRKTIKQ